ncbi:hypothetical protein FF011L_44660 [Roseimaritima multifibrata]|uniref:Uncharacterized protein n=1 Tax=Roseimaritima multifibrata TaxID=1930274 RepID=A0A517ML97_9BACT|nr:hypothetical protein FF011L_44660 [Roseimaritima multifibrata]
MQPSCDRRVFTLSINRRNRLMLDVTARSTGTFGFVFDQSVLRGLCASLLAVNVEWRFRMIRLRLTN